MRSHSCQTFFDRLRHSWPSYKPNLPGLIYSAHLDPASPQICFAVTIMSPMPYNGMKGWAADDLQVLAAASPALLAEDATSQTSQRWEEVTKRCRHPSSHYTHWPSLMSFSDLTRDTLGHTETWEAANYSMPTAEVHQSFTNSRVKSLPEY